MCCALMVIIIVLSSKFYLKTINSGCERENVTISNFVINTMHALYIAIEKFMITKHLRDCNV